jgi:hypothetical protein
MKTLANVVMAMALVGGAAGTALADKSVKDKAIDCVQSYAEYAIGAPTDERVAFYGENAGEYVVVGAKECAELVAKALAEGAPADTAIKTEHEIGTVTLGEATARVCEPAARFGAEWQRKKTALLEGNFDELAAPYKKLGARGALLETLVEYDDIALYGKGCKRLSTPAQRMKAKVWHEFLEHSDGTWGLRTFKIKGQKVTWDEETYHSEAAATRACKR